MYMTLRRVTAAGIVVLAAVYLRLTMPGLAEPLFSTLREMLAAEQLALRLPEGAAAWIAGVFH